MAICKFYEQGTCRFGGTYFSSLVGRRPPSGRHVVFSVFSHFHIALGKLRAPHHLQTFKIREAFLSTFHFPSPFHLNPPSYPILYNPSSCLSIVFNPNSRTQFLVTCLLFITFPIISHARSPTPWCNARRRLQASSFRRKSPPSSLLKSPTATSANGQLLLRWTRTRSQKWTPIWKSEASIPLKVPRKPSLKSQVNCLWPRRTRRSQSSATRKSSSHRPEYKRRGMPLSR